MKAILILTCCILATCLLSQSKLQPIASLETTSRVVEINVSKLSQDLAKAPELSAGVPLAVALQTAPTVELPLPNGSTKTFRMFKTQPMHSALLLLRQPAKVIGQLD